MVALRRLRQILMVGLCRKNAPLCSFNSIPLLLVFWKFSSDDVYVPPDATELEKTAIYSQSSVTKQMSFLGITLVLSISRFVLLAQYLRGKRASV